MPNERKINQMLHETLLGDAWANAAVAVVVVDETGTAIAVNDAYCRLTGHAREDATAPGAGPSLPAGRGTSQVDCADGSTIRVDYCAIPTTVSNLPYCVALLSPVGDSDGDAAGTRRA